MSTESQIKPRRGEFWVCAIEGGHEVRHVLDDSSAPYTQGAYGISSAALAHSRAMRTTNVWPVAQREFVRPATRAEADAWIARFGFPLVCVLPPVEAAQAPATHPLEPLCRAYSALDGIIEQSAGNPAIAVLAQTAWSALDEILAGKAVAK